MESSNALMAVCGDVLYKSTFTLLSTETCVHYWRHYLAKTDPVFQKSPTLHSINSHRL